MRKIPGILIVLAFAGGCATVKENPEDFAGVIDFWQPHLMYTAPEPYPSLLVEVDRMEGVTITPREIESLETMLDRSCDKPGGIAVKMDEVIPLAECENLISKAVALKYMDGPPDDETAYLYVLYYDSGAFDEPKTKPHSMQIPYPGAIMMNRNYAESMERSKTRGFSTRAIQHEVGHSIGLCRNAEHGKNLHCSNKTCLMGANLQSSVSRFVTFRNPWLQNEFCEDCIADMEANKLAEGQENLRFRGAYVVRTEANYQVITLPGFVYVFIGPPEELDWDNVEQDRIETTENLERLAQVIGYLELFPVGKARAEKLLDEVERDPYPFVREVCRNLRNELTIVE